MHTGLKGDQYILMLWLGFTLMNFSSYGCFLIVPIISAQNSKSGMTCQQWPLPHKTCYRSNKVVNYLGRIHNSYHHFSTLAILTLLLLYLNNPQFIFTCSLYSSKSTQQHLHTKEQILAPNTIKGVVNPHGGYLQGSNHIVIDR